MALYDEIMECNHPHLKITFEWGPDRQERFGWSIDGAMPGASLVGYLGRVQSFLWAGVLYPEDKCPEKALVIVWNTGSHQFCHFVHPDIPIDPLCGMLELIKAQMVASQIMGQARQARASQQGGVVQVASAAAPQRSTIFGPDGNPMR